MARALRNMDIAGEPFAKTFWEGDTVTGEEGPPGEEDSEVDPEELAGLDLDEEEAAEVFAVLEQRRRTWSENKKLKQALRKDRSGVMAGSSSSPPVSQSAGGGAAVSSLNKGSGRKRMSIAELKLISRCANCGQKGHWRAECKNPYKPREGPKAASASATATHLRSFLSWTAMLG